MSASEAQPIGATSLPTNSPAEGAVEYPMSSDGRRQAYILLVGVISIMVFAVWSLVTILDGGLDGAEWVSALLMLGILVVSPLVAWTLLEEANSRLTVTEEGVRYSTLGGINLLYPWSQLAGFKQRGGRGRFARFFLGEEENGESVDKKNSPTPALNAQAEANNEDEEESEAETESHALLVRDSYGAELIRQLPNGVVRFLHTQAHGATLPVYSGLENRDELLSQIALHVGTNE